MEELKFALPSAAQPHAREPVLVGVVASGNCEVLVEQAPVKAQCAVTVHTSAHGFAPIWQAVIEDFSARRHVGGLSIEINDVGATPAVVSLRLDQALEVWEEKDTKENGNG
jgi:malonate decarboxylase delta subunit